MIYYIVPKESEQRIRLLLTRVKLNILDSIQLLSFKNSYLHCNISNFFLYHLSLALLFRRQTKDDKYDQGILTYRGRKMLYYI